MADRLVSARVGWNKPSEDGDFIFNFHMKMGRTSWREMVDYKNLTALNTAFKVSNEEFHSIPFPHFGRKEVLFIENIFQQEEYDKDKIKNIERHRSLLEIWINSIANNICHVNTETRRLFKLLFFTSYDNSNHYDGWMRSCGIFEEISLESIEECDESSTNYKNNQLIYNILHATTNKHKAIKTPVLSRRNLDKIFKKKDYLRNNIAGSETVRSETSNSDLNSIHSISNTTSTTLLPSWFKSKSLQEDSIKEIVACDDMLQVLAKHNKTHTILTTEVIKSNESHNGIQVYTILLSVHYNNNNNTTTNTNKNNNSTATTSTSSNKPIVFRCFQRYNNFKALYHKLNECNDNATLYHTTNTTTASTSTSTIKSTPYADFIQLITAPFPYSPIKSYLGLSLNEQELQERTNQLDRWFRDVCYYYRDMPAPAREAIREFLTFNMKEKKDIFVHDQLAWGRIEPNKVDAPILIVRKSTLVTLHDSILDANLNVHNQNTTNSNNDTKSIIRYNLKDMKKSTSSSTSVSLSSHTDNQFVSTCNNSGISNSGQPAAAIAVDLKSMNGSILKPYRKPGSIA